ncbi:MAG: glycoside hydrolase domain-containing protein [Kiritimatiellia bacterium]
MKLIGRVVTGIFLATACCSHATAPPPLLDEKTAWRCHIVRGTELVRLENGDLVSLSELSPAAQVKIAGRYEMALNRAPEPVCTAQPAAGWTDLKFDDNEWPRLSLPIISEGYQPWLLICARARFCMEKADEARGAVLTISYQGGIVVFLNGVEIGRSHLPEGTLNPATPAEDYERNVFVRDDGVLVSERDLEAKGREREYSLTLPSKLLRLGENVLAVEVHRSPAPQIMFLGKPQPGHHANRFWWPRVALKKIIITAVGEETSKSPLGDEALRIYSQDVLAGCSSVLAPEGYEPAVRVSIIGTRNGVFSGQILLSGLKSFENVTVRVSDLNGPANAVIPASAIRVRYAIPIARTTRGPKYFDGLEDEPAPGKGEEPAGARVQPVWFSVRTKSETVPGCYTGRVAIAYGGSIVTNLPLKVQVSAFVLPDPVDFTTHVGLIESPDSVAMKYGVTLWSEKHWELVGQVFSLLATVGNKEIYIPVVRRTHFGNEHGMIRWIGQGEGTWQHDFSIAERYLDLAIKHLKRIRAVCLYVWEPANATGHFPSGTREDHRSQDMPIRFTVFDPKTGELSEGVGPAWGTEECRRFWQPVLEGMRTICEKRGLDQNLMLGLSGDFYPSRQAVEDLAAVAPGLRWIVHSHTYWEKVRGQPVGLLASVWGIAGPRDPAAGADYYGNQRYYGWRNGLVLHLPRAGNYLGPWRTMLLAALYAAPETCLVSVGRANAKPPGVRGFGRVGADFWEVLPKGLGDRGALTLAGRYPETGWGQLTLNFSEPALLHPGRHGPVSTVRLEILREGLQVAEARVFLEKALLDPRSREKLEEALRQRCQAMLDEKVRDCLRRDWTWFIASDWRRRTREIFELAGQVATCLAHDKSEGVEPQSRSPASN